MNRLRTYYVTIFESELRTIAGLSAQQRARETGGNMYGLFTRADRPVIQLVTGPGPKAVHAPAHFQQDIEFFQRTCAVLDDRYGLKWLGNWHAHHLLGLESPSTGDLAQVRSIAAKNDIRQWCDLITVHDSRSRVLPWNRRDHGPRADSNDLPRLRLNAFVYADPVRSEYVRCPLRVLSGTSPARAHALSTGQLTPADLGEPAADFPLQRVRYDSLSSQTAVTNRRAATPAWIIDHLARLPFGVQKQTELYAAQDLVLVSFPLDHGHTANVAYGTMPPHTIRAVCVSDENGVCDDVSRLALREGPATHLDRVHALLMASRGRRPRAPSDCDLETHPQYTVEQVLS